MTRREHQLLGTAQRQYVDVALDGVRRPNPDVVTAFREELAERLSHWPAGAWEQLRQGPDGGQLQHKGRRLRVIWSIGVELDDRHWLHVSVSLPGRIPMHDELAFAKGAIVGEDRYAYSVWPPKDMHVSLGEVLHLWAPLDGDPPIPEFSRVIRGVRTI